MIIFDHGYSCDVDGKGCRLVFYLKGCNFCCDWCGAPESICASPETLHYPERTVIAGENVSVQWLTNKALRCNNMIDGVTFGGGEPTLQAKELTEALKILKSNNIHTALETNASAENYPEIINYVDQLFSDLKTVSEEKFVKRIKADSSLLEKVKNNLQYAALNHRDLTIRIPVITDFNDTLSEQGKIAAFLSGMIDCGGKFVVQLLRQHHLAEAKYRALNRPYPCRDVTVPDDQVMKKFTEILKSHKIKVIEK